MQTIREVLNKEKFLSLLVFGTRARLQRSLASVVMSFGDGSQGALGLPSFLTGFGADAYEPTCVPSLPPDITSVSTGHYHSLAVSSRGELWAWGRNHEAQLGRGHLTPRDSWNEPKRVEGLRMVHILAAYASGVVSCAIGDDGSLWVWGKSKHGQLGLGMGITEAAMPSRVEALAEEKIAKISFGWGHALAITQEGKLFGWGYSADGRLGTPKNPPMGLEKDLPVLWVPSLVDEVDITEVVDVACGLDHSLVLCRDGTLLSSGSNLHGQLGRANKDAGFHPVDVGVNCHPVLSIAAGLGHSLAICSRVSAEADKRSVVSWGWNQSFQLGRDEPGSIPLAISKLAGEEADSVSCGRAHSLFLTSRKELWACGCGRNGRLGLGHSADVCQPTFIDALEGRQVLQAASGLDHTLLLISQ